MKPHMTNTDNPIDFPADSEVPRLLDPGCAERGCMGYDPFSGDTECVEFYHKDLVEQLREQLRSYEKTYELNMDYQNELRAERDLFKVQFDNLYEICNQGDPELTDVEVVDVYEEWRALSGDPVKLYRLFKLKEQAK